jgi:hypothetical protein
MWWTAACGSGGRPWTLAARTVNQTLAAWPSRPRAGAYMWEQRAASQVRYQAQSDVSVVLRWHCGTAAVSHIIHTS